MPTTQRSTSAAQPTEGIGVRVADWIINHPGKVSCLLVAGTVVHGFLAWPFRILSPYKAAQYSTDPNTTSAAISTTLGVTSAAAILAGLSGVILVFTVGASSPRLQAFRSQAGRPLQRTWVALVLEPLVAAGAGLISAISQATSGRVVAPFIMEGGLILLVHTSFRLVWLLYELVKIVAADDSLREQKERTLSVEELLGED